MSVPFQLETTENKTCHNYSMVGSMWNSEGKESG